MNKTVSVSIGGFAFILSDDAHRRLEQYIEKVRINLGNSADTEEILSDVEGRMAELLGEYLSASGRQVVDVAMVEKMIAVMGAPEDFNVSGEAAQGQQSQQEPQDRAAHRALYRETEDRYLGGVCAGIAHYLGWEPLIVRLIFLLLLFGFGSSVIVYLVLWILVPQAKTTAEKLRMHGKPVNLESIKERFQGFGEEVKEMGKEIRETRRRGKRSAIGKRVEDAILEIGRVISSVLGIFFLLLGTLLCIGVVILFFGKQLYVGSEDNFVTMTLRDPSLVFDRVSDFSFIWWGSFTILMLITIGFFLSGTKLLFRIRLKHKLITGANIAISVVAVVFICLGLTNVAKQFSHEETVTQVKPVSADADTLYITAGVSSEFSEGASPPEMVKVKNAKLLFGYPQFDIHLSDSPTARMEVKKHALGSGRSAAIQHAENISYAFDISGDTIHFEPEFTAPLSDKFRGQEVQTRLFVPEGTVVFLDEGSRKLLSLFSCETSESFWDHEYWKAKTFIMEKEGLKAL